MDQQSLFDPPAEAATSSDDRRKSRGAVLVETVLIITVLLTMLFGVVEFGMAIRSKHGLSEASRAGARVAAALPRDTSFNTAAANSVRAAVLDALPNGDVSRLVIYRANGDTGEPVSGTVDSCSQCYTYLWDEPTEDWVLQSGSEWLASTQWACGLVDQTDFVGVHLTGNYDFVTAFFVDDIALTSRTVMRLEPVIGTSQCSPSSNPPPTAAPTGTPTPGPSVTPSATPTVRPTATPWPSGVPTYTPTPTPSPTPTATPTPAPTGTPTTAPTATPTPNGGGCTGWCPDFAYYYAPWDDWVYVWWDSADLPDPSDYPSGCTYYGYWHGGSYHSGGWEITCGSAVSATPTPTASPTPTATPTPNPAWDYDVYYTGWGSHWYVWYDSGDLPDPSEYPSGCSYWGYWHGGSYHSGGYEIQCSSAVH